jgi:hydroxymethylbilane synthase
LGTRGSLLALAQAETIARMLRGEGHEVEVVKIVTTGDRVEGPLSEHGGKKVWVEEIEKALLDGTIDLAVHSAKDLPTTLADGLTIGAYPQREDPRDAFAGPPGRRIAALPPGARVGTGSARRMALLRALRPDLEPVAIRGNVPTRIAKIETMELAGVILAAAGLVRLGLEDRLLDPLDPERYVPAGGQGALAIEIRIDDEDVHQIVSQIDERDVAAQIRAERAFLFELGGDCHTPIAAFATIHGIRLRLRALVISPDGRERVEGSAEGEIAAPEMLGATLGRELLGRGPRRLIEGAGERPRAAGRRGSGRSGSARCARCASQRARSCSTTLIDPAVLALARPARASTWVSAATAPRAWQDKIADLMIERRARGSGRAAQGRRPVRVRARRRGGSRLRAAGVPFGSSRGSPALAVPATPASPSPIGVFVVARVVTGHRGKQRDHRIDWEGLAQSAETLVILMGTRWLPDIAARIVAGGRDPATPAAAIERGTTPQQRVVVARLGDLAERVRAAGLAAPVVVVIGRVVEFREQIAWYEQLPLFAKRVLVPRAPQQADELALELRRRGAAPVAVPLLEFAPSSRPEELARACAAAAEYDWIVFTSANAVRASAPLLAPLGRARVACIGAATARAASAGLRVELRPQEEGSPRRCAEPRALAPAGARIPRARRGRRGAGPGARPPGRAGRRPRPTGRAPAGARAARAALEDGIDAVALTSLDRRAPLRAARARRAGAPGAAARFACIGATTAEALRAPGGATLSVAERPSMAALVAALERACAEEPDGLS